MKRPDDGRNEAGGHDNVGANAQFAGRRVGQIFDFLDALSQLVEGGQPVLQQCGAEDRRLGAMTVAVKQTVELFKMMTGINIVHVPYVVAPAMLTDLLGAQVQVAFDGISSSFEHIRAGKLHALAVATSARLEALPDIPTIGESLPGFEASGWCGIAAPRNTPIEIIDKLNTEINAGLADPKIKARLADLGVIVLAGTPAEFAKHIADETEKWGKLIKMANIKPD